MIRHPLRWGSAALMLALVSRPAMLPHSERVQALVGGLAAAQGYALAALIGRLLQARLFLVVKHFSVPSRKMLHDNVIQGLGPLGGGGLVVLAVVVSRAHAQELAARASLPNGSLWSEALGEVGAVLVAVLLVWAAAGIRQGVRTAIRSLRHPPRRAVALFAAPALALTGCAIGPGPATAASAPASTATASSRAAGAQTVVDTVGTKGADFVAALPSPAAISAATGRRSISPVRVYVDRDAASTAADRARLAVADLDRAGGFERANLLIDIPTGSGWVNPAGVRALEYLSDGDLATVVTQYATSPSWLAYLRGGQGVQESARTLIDAVRARIDRQPAGHRPRLLVYGESLGAWGGLRAYPGALGAGLSRRTDGALWVGVPGGLPQTTERTAVLIHPDDPVPVWSPRLIVRPVAGLHRHWLPLVSFWQATADVVSAERTRSGFGHRYGGELLGAWCGVLDLPACGVAYSSTGRADRDG